MSKFTTLNLKPYFNGICDPSGWHPEIREKLGTLPGGQKTFWGIPFNLSQPKDNYWLLLESNNSLVNIPLRTTAHYVVFAHFCDLSHDPEGLEQPIDYKAGEITRPGEHLADYILIYADGSKHCQPIRRRFEVGEAIIAWGQLAFAARPHFEHKVLDWRSSHSDNSWGPCQTGVSLDPDQSSLWYWLYAMENPHPELEITTILLVSTGADRLAIAGITLYHGLDHPLCRHRLESLEILLPEPKVLDTVDTNVDLGTITRCYSVPAFNPDQWLNDQPKGCGEELLHPQTSNRLILDITANLDAELDVDGHSANLRSVFENGRTRSTDGQVGIEFLSPCKTWVHAKVIDDDTNEPTPVRIHFRASDGRYLPPYGHRHEVNDNLFEDYGGDLKLGSTQYAYVDGCFQIELPMDEVYVEIVKGFEYQPVRQRITIEPDQHQLTLHIQRRLNWRCQGWVTADTHVHFISPQTARLEAQSEGINLVNLLAVHWGDLFTNVSDITGDVSELSRDDTIIWVGTENRHHLLGHISLLGVKGSPIFPMATGGPNESYFGDSTSMSLAEWSDMCREREGLVVIPHFPNPYCEVAADIVLGKVDAVEIRYFTPALEGSNIREWYRFLNCGYRVAAVGGTDKMSAGMPVGGVRTYAWLGKEAFTFDNWARAVRAGQTFTTSGPLIGLSVEGYGLGEEIHLSNNGGTLEVEAWVESVQPFHELQIIVNGEIIHSQLAEEGVFELRLKDKVRLDRSAWIAARCISRFKVHHSWWPINIAAHTSPVYVRCGDKDLFSKSDALYMLTLIDGGLTWLDTLAIPADPVCHQRIRGVFNAASGHLQKRIAGHNHKQISIS